MNTPTQHRSDPLRQNITNTHARSQTLERLSLTGLVIVLSALVVYYGLKQIRTIDESVADKSVALLKKDPGNTSAVTNSEISTAKKVSPTPPVQAAEKLQLSQQRMDQESIAKTDEFRIGKAGERTSSLKQSKSNRDESDSEIVGRASRRPRNLELQRSATGKSANYAFPVRLNSPPSWRPTNLPNDRLRFFEQSLKSVVGSLGRRTGTWKARANHESKLGINPRMGKAPKHATPSPKLFPVSSDKEALSRVGFIDPTGKVVIDFRFYSADPFSEGLARVTLARDGQEGYINRTGQVVIEPKFDRAFPFKEKRAKVRVNTKWGFIDPKGKIIVEPRFEEADNFYEGLARVKVDGKWGYIDGAGKLVIPAIFKSANRFSEGLACVMKDDRLGYVDRTGSWVITAQFERMGSPADALSLPNFKEGLAVARKGERFGYIDKSGEFVIPPYFDRAESFSEGLAPIRIQNKVGYINKAGAIAVTPQFDVARQFSEGLAEIAIDHKWGFIDATGKIVIEPQFDLVMRFTNGLADVSVGRTAGYIDKRGKWVWVTNWK